MKHRPEILIQAALALFLLCAIGHCEAQPQAKENDPNKWKQSFTTYFWLPAQNGDAVVRGRPVDVDISISDSWDALSSLDGAAVFHYEAQKKRSYILADLFYIKLEDNVSTAQGDAEFENSQTIAELATALEVSRKMLNTGRIQTVDLLGGLRYSKLALKLKGAVNAEGDQSWIDPFIGARLTRRLSDQWTFWTRGDIGGFGIGDASDFTWNLVLGFQYILSDMWELNLGWRWLDYDHDTGSGNSRFEYDVLLDGPFIGFTYNW
ncbi:MAG: hypothetical protein ABFD46_01685 [Armatimonadota bacterium]